MRSMVEGARGPRERRARQRSCRGGVRGAEQARGGLIGIVSPEFRALGEGPGGASPITPSCVDQAIRDARPQVRLATNQAYARAYYASLGLRSPYAPIP